MNRNGSSPEGFEKTFHLENRLVIASVTMIIIKTFYFNKAYIKYCNLLRMSVVKYVSVLLLRSVARVPVVLGSAPWTEIAPCFINKKKNVFSQKQNSLKPLLWLILKMTVFDVKFSSCDSNI